MTWGDVDDQTPKNFVYVKLYNHVFMALTITQYFFKGLTPSIFYANGIWKRFPPI